MRNKGTAVAVALLLLGALLGSLALLPGAPAVTAQGNDYAYVVLQSAAITNGNGTAVLPINSPNSYGELTVQVTGRVSGTVNWETTINGSTWITLPATNVATGVSAVTAVNGVYRMDVTGLTQVRARVSGVTITTTDSINVVGHLTKP